MADTQEPDTPPALEVTHRVTPHTTPDKDYLSQALQVLTLIRDGHTVASAGQQLGISRSTAFARLRLIEDDTERGVVKLLNAKALDLAEDWVKASSIAAEKGDHRPAQDALLHARAIDPLADAGNQGARIAIIIGTPEHPIRVHPPQPVVVDTIDP